jgi:RNA polymerase sigma-70 factor (ECF subfamily)
LGQDIKGLFLAYRRELQAYLTEKLRDADIAADLTQETFLRYAERRQGDGAAVVHDRSYLYRTAHNLVIDHVRQRARQHTDTAANEDLARVAEDRPSVEDVIDARRNLGRLRAAVEELPERTRQIFVLGRIEGLSYRQIADRLGISESSVQKHLARALRHTMQRTRPTS